MKVSLVSLGDQPTNIDPNDIEIMVKYIYNSYVLDTSSGTSSENLCLLHLLNTSNICLRTLVSLVPTIEQHVTRACSQAGYLLLQLDIPDPTSLCWKLYSVSTFSYIPLWQDYTSPDVHSSLKTCLCTKG